MNRFIFFMFLCLVSKAFSVDQPQAQVPKKFANPAQRRPVPLLNQGKMPGASSQSVLHGQEVRINTGKYSYSVFPNQVTAQPVWNETTKSYDTVYTLSGEAGIHGQETNSYSRTIQVTKTGDNTYQVSGVINESASGKGSVTLFL